MLDGACLRSPLEVARGCARGGGGGREWCRVGRAGERVVAEQGAQALEARPAAKSIQCFDVWNTQTSCQSQGGFSSFENQPGRSKLIGTSQCLDAWSAESGVGICTVSEAAVQASSSIELSSGTRSHGQA